MCFGDPELGNAEASGKKSGRTQESQSDGKQRSLNSIELPGTGVRLEAGLRS